MNLLVDIFLIFCFIVFFNSTIVILFKKKFGMALPISLISMTLVMIASQLIFKTFKIGLYLNYLVALLSIIILLYMFIYNKIKKKKYIFKDIFNNIFSSGFYALLGIFIILTIVNFNRNFTTWDELSHWGEMVKEMFRLDKFYTEDISTLIFHKDYPPFISVFELMWCKIANNYSETLITMAIQVFSLSLLTPMLIEFNEKKSKLFNFFSNILINLAMITIIIAFDADNVFPTIYTDFFMAFLFVYSMSLVFTKKIFESKFAYFSFLMSSIGLLLTKQMGIALFLMSLTYYVIELIINKIINKNNIKKYLIKILVLLIIPFMFLKIWNGYVDNFNLEKQFDLSDIKIANVVKIIDKEKGFENRHDGMKNFIVALYSRPLYNNIIGITYLSSLFLVLALLYIIWYFYKKYLDKKEAINLGFILTCGTVGYAFTMLILYLFSFDEGECVGLASYNRYMSTYIVSEILILVLLTIYLEIKRTKEKLDFGKIFVISMLILAILRGGNLSFFLPSMLKDDPMNVYRYAAEPLIEKTNENSKIMLIDDGFGQYQIFIHYFANPRVLDRNYANVLNLEYTKKIKNDIIDEMKKNDYIYVLGTNEKFEKEFNNIFENNKVVVGAIYKVNIDEKDNLKLIIQ